MEGLPGAGKSYWALNYIKGKSKIKIQNQDSAFRQVERNIPVEKVV